ncbi:MAG: hypothetical protein ACREKM_10555 [Longimicrobiales bacterium]
MTGERRYQQDEVSEIFEAAATTDRPSPTRAPASAQGLTLADLQSIGSEVGLSAARIAEAAGSLELRRTAQPVRTSFGMPISAGRTVDLPRAPTDREWALLVTDLRETFHAQGRDGSRGNVRAWSNGNLHAYIEPTETGYRLRMGTVKGDATGLNQLGAFGIVFAVVMFVVMLLNGNLADDIVAPVVLGAMGAAGLGYNALRLPRWSEEREEQMAHIAARAQMLIRGPAET